MKNPFVEAIGLAAIIYILVKLGAWGLSSLAYLLRDLAYWLRGLTYWAEEAALFIGVTYLILILVFGRSRN